MHPEPHIDMIRGDDRRRFRVEGLHNDDEEFVRLPRPRPPEMSGLVLAVGGFLMGALVSGSLWGGLAGGALVLLVWGGWSLKAGP